MAKRTQGDRFGRWTAAAIALVTVSYFTFGWDTALVILIIIAVIYLFRGLKDVNWVDSDDSF